MKMKMMYGIAGAIALTTVGAFADEAADLREDMEALNERLASLEKENKEAQSGWQTKVRVKGDFRYRYQLAESEDNATGDLQSSKNIQRIRARLGVFADVNDFTEAAIGIRTGSSANSGNVTLGSGFSGKDISLSLAYLRLNPEDGKYGALTMGKMKQPWKATTDMIWDGDVNPEGLAYGYDGKAGDTGLFGSLGYFKVTDSSTASDVDLNTIQGGVAQPLGEKIKGVLGASYYAYRNVDQLTPSPDLATGYRVAEGFAELGVKEVGPIPFKFYGNYVNNTAVDDQNSGWCAGVKFGDAKKGKWEAKYDYRDLELFAAPGLFTDSDFADGGSGVKGHRIKAKYNFAKNLQGGVAYVYSLRTPDGTITQDQQFNSLFLDLMVKF